jgi:FAD/FMN-containing dehydrogenase
VEGTGEVCDRSARDLVSLAGQPATKNIQSIVLNEDDGADLWHYIGQAVPVLLETSPAAAIFKIAQLPSRLGPLINQLSAVAGQLSLAHAVMARGCGVVYFALLPQTNNAAPLQDLANEADTLSRLTTAASAIFQLCARETASATLPWCPTALKHGLRILDVSAGHRLKSAFDPHNIFAPGRAI